MPRRSLHKLCVTMSLSVALAALVANAQSSGPATPPADVPQATPVADLDKGIVIQPTSLRVTADGGLAFYAAAPEPTAGAKPQFAYYMLNIRAGQHKATPLLDAIAADARKEIASVRSVEPSADGSKLLVVANAADGKQQAAFVVNLPGGEAVKLAEAPGVAAAWAGENVMLSVHSAGGLETLKVMDAAGKQIGTIDVKLGLLDVSADGKVLLGVGMAPNDVTGRLMTADRDGKVLRELAMASSLSGAQPVLSPGGKYVVFASKPTGTVAQHRLHMLTSTGTSEKVAPVRALPVAASDTGQVLAMGAEIDPKVGTFVKLWNVQGQSPVLATDAVAAAVSNGRLFYVAAGQTPVLKSLPVDLKNE